MKQHMINKTYLYILKKNKKKLNYCCLNLSFFVRYFRSQDEEKNSGKKHTFTTKIHLNKSLNNLILPRVEVLPRKYSASVHLRGMFAGARVERGRDWRFGDQDGRGGFWAWAKGAWGTVTEVRGWTKDSSRGAVEVRWYADGRTNVYRVGYEGKVCL